MRRVFATGWSLIFSLLALVGGVEGMVLCLHQAGAIHLESSSPVAPGVMVCADDSIDDCGPRDAHECDWHMDLAVEGIGLAKLRLDEGQDHIPPLHVIITIIAAMDWHLPGAHSQNLPQQKAPSAPPSALLVAKTTVLII